MTAYSADNWPAPPQRPVREVKIQHTNYTNPQDLTSAIQRAFANHASGLSRVPIMPSMDEYVAPVVDAKWSASRVALGSGLSVSDLGDSNTNFQQDMPPRSNRKSVPQALYSLP